MRHDTTESPRAFAKRLNVSHQVIGRALASGRLAACVRIVGRRRKIQVAIGLREWRENAAKLPPAAPVRRQSAILVPRDQFSVSVWDNVILLARVRADGEPLYLMPIDRPTAAVLGLRLLELAGNADAADDGETDRQTP